MDDLRRRIDELLGRVAEWEARNAELQRRNAELEARNVELERQLKRRGKKYTPKPNTKKSGGQKTDRRKQPHRTHPGVFREPPTPDEDTIYHDVRLPCCPHCGGEDLQDSGRFDDHWVEEIPQPKVELHCYRRHEQECQQCGRRFQGRGEREIPGDHIGPRARLLAGYCRAHLGISLEKTDDLLGRCSD
jgi:hypothetical protein